MAETYLDVLPASESELQRVRANPVFGADGGNPLHICSARLCKFLSGLRTAKMDGNFFAKLIQRAAPAARDING
jgi:hypothetical protein